MLSKNLIAVAAAIVPAFAQEAAPNLTALVASDDRLSTLATILQSYPDVAAGLANATNVTVLAPTNEAFQTFLEGAGIQLQDVTSAQVSAILNYHILNGTIYAANITESPTFAPTLLENETYTTITTGQVVEARVEDGDVIITSGLKSDATVVEPDLNFTGGVAHIIDAVNVIPENITATASAANLTYFLGALELANLTSTLAGLSDVTIFAPSNDAFESIGSALGNLSTDALVAILEYHVINGTVAYSSTVGNGTVETLGGEANLTVADNAIFVNQARVVNPDILISSGVIHIIDAVLNPNGTAQANATDDEPVEAFEGASSAPVSLSATGIPQATTTIENLVTTTLQVASGYTTVTEGPVGSGAGGAGATESSTEAGAMVTGAVGMVALFGGAAFVANM